MSTNNPLITAPNPGGAPAPARRDWRLRLPFFYGWAVVAGSFVALGLVYAVWYSFSVFYVALLEEFHWGRAVSAGVFSLFVTVWALGGIGAGALADRLGPGRVMAAGTVVLAGGLVASSRIAELWQFYLLFGIVCALGVSLAAWIPCITLISQWFSARLGIALGVASAGIGVGILVMVPLAQGLISLLGWRTAYVALAGIIFVGVVPISLLVLRGRPEDLGLPRDGRRPLPTPQARPQGAPIPYQDRVMDREWAGRDWTVAMAMRTRRYWLLSGLLAVGNAATQMIFVHQVAFLVDGGYDRLLAASIVGLIGLISAGAKIGWGWVSDRIGRELTWTIGMALLTLSMGLLIATRLVAFPPLVYLFSLIFALGCGVSAPLPPAVGADLFGGRRFGSIYGSLSLANGIGNAFGAWFGGYVFDVTGSYLLALALGAATYPLSAIAMWLVAPRKVRRVPGQRVK